MKLVPKESSFDMQELTEKLPIKLYRIFPYRCWAQIEAKSELTRCVSRVLDRNGFGSGADRRFLDVLKNRGKVQV